MIARGLCAFLLCLACAGPGNRSRQPNIVLVVLDTARSDFTGPGGNRDGLTPALDSLGAGGTVFHNARTSAPWTLPSHASMFTGMLSSAHGCHINHWRLEPDRATLAQILSRSGYETAAFFSNPWLRDEMTGVLHGFELRLESPISNDEMSLGRSDQGGRDINHNIANWIDRRGRGRPFFLFVNYLEAHLPYDPPADYRKAHLADLPPDDQVSVAWSDAYLAGLHPTASVDWSRIRRLYGGDVHQADALLAGLVAMLKTHGYYDDAVIIVTSDHGENLGEHDLMDHQYSVHETLLSVPLVIHAPGRLQPGVHDEPVMLLDLFASVLDFAGIEGQTIPPLSRSFRALDDPSTDKAQWNDRVRIAEYGGGHPSLLNGLRRLNPQLDTRPFERGYRSVRWRNYRLTISTDGAAWLHDLSADPGQLHNIVDANKPLADELYAAMVRVSSGDFHGDAQTPEIDAESLKKLRSLGYIK